MGDVVAALPGFSVFTLFVFLVVGGSGSRTLPVTHRQVLIWLLASVAIVLAVFAGLWLIGQIDWGGSHSGDRLWF